MKTIAQQLDIKDFPFKIKDKDGNEIYYENSDGHWEKREYDSEGNEIYYENSDGYWANSKYDWGGNKIYYENSDGDILDNRLKKDIITVEEMKTPLQEFFQYMEQNQYFIGNDLFSKYHELLEKESDLLDQHYEEGWNNGVQVMKEFESRKEER